MTSSTSEIDAYLDQVGPYEFEQFVADVWEEFGYSTEVTSGSQDRGIDVIAERDTPVKKKELIQAKAYREGNRIGSDEVRKYATLYQQEDDANGVVLVTTSGFTSQAKELAQDLDVDTIGRDDLIELVDDADMLFNIEANKLTSKTGSGGKKRHGERINDPNNYDIDSPKVQEANAGVEAKELEQTSGKSDKQKEHQPSYPVGVFMVILLTTIAAAKILSMNNIISEAVAGVIIIIISFFGFVVIGVVGWANRTGRIDL